jgi:hypothetical protein
LLENLQVEGFLVVHKAKLLRLLGRERDRKEAWSDLLELWKDTMSETGHLYVRDLPDGRVLISNAKLLDMDTRA